MLLHSFDGSNVVAKDTTGRTKKKKILERDRVTGGTLMHHNDAAFDILIQARYFSLGFEIQGLLLSGVGEVS